MQFLKVDVSHRRGHSSHSSLGFPFHFSLSCSKPTESVCPVNHDGYIRVIVMSYMTPDYYLSGNKCAGLEATADAQPAATKCNLDIT